MGIRSTAKGIIIDRDRVLLNKCFDKHNGEYYSLPGGGQSLGETLEEALIRESLEETGYQVEEIKFAALYEEICDDPKIVEEYPEYIHKMYHIFTCRIKNMERVIPTEIDNMQVESLWIPIEELSAIRFLPRVLNDNILEIISSNVPRFLGSDHIPYNHG